MDGVNTTLPASPLPEPSRKREREASVSSSVSSVDPEKQILSDDSDYSLQDPKRICETKPRFYDAKLEKELIEKFTDHVLYELQDREPSPSVTGYIELFKKRGRFEKMGVRSELLTYLNELEKAHKDSDDDHILITLIRKRQYNDLPGIDTVRKILESRLARASKGSPEETSDTGHTESLSSIKKLKKAPITPIETALPDNIKVALEVSNIDFQTLPYPESPSATLINLRKNDVRLSAVIRVARLISDHNYEKMDAVKTAQEQSDQHWVHSTSLNQSLTRWFRALSIKEAECLGLTEVQLKEAKAAFPK